MTTNYQNGKIYRITSLGTSDIYIGSTVKKYLSSRLAEHIYYYDKYLNGNKYYISSYEILKHGDYEIRLIESYPCENKNDLLKKEQEYIDIYENICVNKQKAYTGLSIQEYNKQYRKNNRQKISEKITCACGAVVRNDYLSKHKRTKKHINFINNKS